MRIISVLTIFVISFISAFAQLDPNPVPVYSSEKLKILSWNIYMLPRFIKNTGKIERAEVIGRELANKDYDVIVFQEAFHCGARKRIRKELEKKYKYSAGPANQNGLSFKTNSGIWIFSKHPIVASQSIIFHNCWGIDAFSRKGALIVELNVNGKNIQIIGTHLQSSGGEWIRQSQCVELAERLIKPFEKPGVPQVICGDFNIDKGASYLYNKMLQMLDAHDSEMSGSNRHSYDRVNNDLHDDKYSKKQDLIDYILFKKNNGRMDFISKHISIFTFPWHKDHNDLSDHYPLEAEILFDNTTKLTDLY